MPTWTGDTISLINNLLRERYDMRGIQSLRVYRNALLDRVEKVSDKESLFAYVGGRGYIMGLQTAAPMNAVSRAELDDWPLPGKTEFQRMVIKEVQYAASTGITLEEQEEARKSEAALANLVDIKLRDLRDDLRVRLNAAICGDGTGRLATFTLSANGATGTLSNTSANFGIHRGEFLLPGMPVTIVKYAMFSGVPKYMYAATNPDRTIVAVTDTTVTFDQELPGDSTATFIIFSRGVVDSVAAYNSSWGTDGANGSNNITLKDGGEMVGLIHLVENSSAGFAASSTRSRLGNNYFGLNRTSYPTLQSLVVDAHTGGAPDTEWTIETIAKMVRAIQNGYGGGRTTAIYCHPDMAAAIARKGFSEYNGRVIVNDPKVTWGYYTESLNVEGQIIPIIRVSQRFPRHTVIGVCEDDIMLFQPFPINFVNPYTGESGNKQVFFGSPGQRNMTFEAWLRFVGQLVSVRCDNHWRIDGLSPDV